MDDGKTAVRKKFMCTQSVIKLALFDRAFL